MARSSAATASDCSVAMHAPAVTSRTLRLHRCSAPAAAHTRTEAQAGWARPGGCSSVTMVASVSASPSGRSRSTSLKSTSSASSTSAREPSMYALDTGGRASATWESTAPLHDATSAERAPRCGGAST